MACGTVNTSHLYSGRDITLKARRDFRWRGGVVTQDAERESEFLKVRIDLPSFQFDVATRDPRSALSELRRILEIMHADDEIAYEEFVQQELRASFSDAFLRNAQAMGTIKAFLKQEQDYRIATAEIPMTLDLDARTRSGRISSNGVRSAIGRLTSGLECGAVKQGVIHVVGDVDREGKVIIADHIHRAMPTAQLRAFHTRKGGERIAVECIFFGEFEEDD